MCILMPCTKQVTAKQMAQMFFQNVWVHFGLPKSIIYDRDSQLDKIMIIFMLWLIDLAKCVF